jgi:hypothetical protein
MQLQALLRCLDKSQTDLALEVGSQITPRLFFYPSGNEDMTKTDSILSERFPMDLRQEFSIARKINIYKEQRGELSVLDDKFKLSQKPNFAINSDANTQFTLNDLKKLAIRLVNCSSFLE